MNVDGIAGSTKGGSESMMEATESSDMREGSQASYTILESRDDFIEWRERLLAIADAPGTLLRAVQTPEWIEFELAIPGRRVDPAIVVVMENGVLVGYAPFLMQSGKTLLPLGRFRLPLRSGRYLRILGGDVVACKVHLPLVHEAAARAVSERLSATVIHVQETQAPSLIAESVVSRDKRYRVVRSNLVEQLTWSIDAPGSLDAYLAKFSKKRRNSLLSKSRTVRRNLDGNLAVEVFERPEQVDAYCTYLDHVYKRSWHVRRTSIEWSSEPLLSTFRELARKGRLVGYVLLLEGAPIAFVHGYHVGGIYEIDNLGYDEAYGRHGVGSMLVFESLQDFFRRYPGSGVDFGYGHNDYKRVFSNRSVAAESLFLVRGMSAILLRSGFAFSRVLRRIVVAARSYLRKE